VSGPIREKLVGGGESPGSNYRRPDDRRRLRSGGKGTRDNKSEEQEEGELHGGRMRERIQER
jgi:hypothetical protein